jgi:excisionase family DNA binding protein
MQESTPTTIFSISQAATFLNITTKTLRRWEKLGVIKPKRNPLNHRIFHLRQLSVLKKHHHSSKANTAYLTSTQAAEKLGISLKTLRRWNHQGKITSIRNNRNQLLFDIKQIELLLQQTNSRVHPNSSMPTTQSIREPFRFPVLAHLIWIIPSISYLSSLTQNPSQSLAPQPHLHLSSIPIHLTPTGATSPSPNSRYKTSDVTLSDINKQSKLEIDNVKPLTTITPKAINPNDIKNIAAESETTFDQDLDFTTVEMLVGPGTYSIND